jgi:C4-dicarboxylate-specific signal transduction histidine kinase
VIRRFLAAHPAALSLGLVVLVFTVDLSLPLGVASAVPYTFAVLLALSARPYWIAVAVAGLCGVLTVAKMEIVPERGTTEMWKVIANRCLALFAIGMTTLLGMLRRRADAERQRAEEKLREHQADLAHMGRLSMLGQIATTLAHELNQPLAAVCLQADIAARLAVVGSPVRQDLPATLAEIAEQSGRAAEIIKSIRRLAKRAEPGRDPTDVNDAIRAVARLLDWQASRAGVSVELRLAESLGAALGDRVQIEQVLFNLLQNAIEAVLERTEGPRCVTIESRSEADMVAISVRDTGVGLSDPERVFERFYTTKPHGMGMGLAISRSIIEAHTGKLLASPADGGGAVFKFTLPLARREET